MTLYGLNASFASLGLMDGTAQEQFRTFVFHVKQATLKRGENSAGFSS